MTHQMDGPIAQRVVVEALESRRLLSGVVATDLIIIDPDPDPGQRLAVATVTLGDTREGTWGITIVASPSTKTSAAPGDIVITKEIDKSSP